MSWTRDLPTEPGRFWWRNTNPLWGRPSYGLLLVQWVAHDFSSDPPHLSVRTVIEMGGISGETERGNGWSFTSGFEVSRWLEQNRGIELWSEPENGPQLFLPGLPGKPEWSPPPPREKPKCTCRGREPHATRRDCLTPYEEKRLKKIAEAAENQRQLYECTPCESLLFEDELVEVRECPKCNDKQFNADDGRNCPDCNSPFTRRGTKFGCPECFEECGEFTGDE